MPMDIVNLIFSFVFPKCVECKKYIFNEEYTEHSRFHIYSDEVICYDCYFLE